MGGSGTLVQFGGQRGHKFVCSVQFIYRESTQHVALESNEWDKFEDPQRLRRD